MRALWIEINNQILHNILLKVEAREGLVDLNILFGYIGWNGKVEAREGLVD